MQREPRMTRRGWLQGASLTAAMTVLSGQPMNSAHSRSRLLRGINLAGAEFGEQNIPGRFGIDYTYPEAATFARFKSYGFDCVRLPCRWERLQPDIDAGLDEAEWRRLAGAIEAARHNGQTIIIDVHNSARRRVRADGFNAEHMIGSPLVPVESLARFWSQLARATIGYGHVVHGIMNEPADIEPPLWLDIANRTIAAIRAAGAGQLILAPGVDWTGAHSWFKSGNTLMRRLVDPGRNLAIDVHQYLDTDSSGRSGRSVSRTIGSERLEAFQEWAREHRIKAFLGEFGAGSDPTSVAALIDLLIEVERNPDVWIGWAAWAAGPWWPPDEPLRLEPDSAGVLPAQTRAMMRFTQAAHIPDDVIEGAAIDLDLARQRYHGVARLEDAISVSRKSAGWALDRSGALVHFEPGTPRRTDLGLAIEAGSRNALRGVEPVEVRAGDQARAVSPQKAMAVLPTSAQVAHLLGPRDTVTRWQLRASEATTLLREAAGSTITFGFHVLSDPQKRISLAVKIGSSHAEIDLARRTAEMMTGLVAISISGSGMWRRVTLALPVAAVPANGLVLLQKSSEPGDEVAVAAPMLFAGTVSASWADGIRASDEASIARPLIDLMRAPACTFMIETRALCTLPIDLPLVGSPSGVLLQRRADGALASPVAGRNATEPIGAHAWEQRRRAVVVVDRRKNRLTLATTGQPPVTSSASWPPLDRMDITIGSRRGERQFLDGLVTRLLIHSRALEAEEAAMLAGQ